MSERRPSLPMKTSIFFLLLEGGRGFQTSRPFAHIIAHASTLRADSASPLSAAVDRGESERGSECRQFPRGKRAINFVQACEAYQEEMAEGQAAIAQFTQEAEAVAAAAKATANAMFPRARVLQVASQGRPDPFASPFFSGGWGGSSGGALNSGASFPASGEERAGRPPEQASRPPEQASRPPEQAGESSRAPPPRWETPPTEQRPRGGAPAMGYMPVQYLKMSRADDKVRQLLSQASTLLPARCEMAPPCTWLTVAPKRVLPSWVYSCT
jgi:hypothetical protein